MQFRPLFREFDILSRAVSYNNLSSAAANIGLSQPQLSRVISRIEQELKITLLERTVKRKSTWTPLARQLGQSFQKYESLFIYEIQNVLSETGLSTIRFGVLEGMIENAIPLVHKLFSSLPVSRVHMNVYDLNELEELFLRSELDVCLSVRTPGKRKYKNEKEIGYQTMSLFGSGYSKVLSEYEFLSSQKRGRWDKEKLLISNSLGVRRAWTEAGYGKGYLPSKLKKQKSEKDLSVILLGQDHLPEKIWKCF